MNRRHLLTAAVSATALLRTSGSAQDASMTDVLIETDIPYGEADGQPLLVNVYRLPDAASPRPAVILLHGVNTRGVPYPPRRDDGEAALLATAGFVGVTVGYRLFDLEADRNAWPVQLDDVQLAVRWLRATAATYGIDPERIGAYGHSNGGQLAALLGVRDTRQTTDAAHAEQSSRVSCVVSLAGDMDLAIPYLDEQTQAATDAYLGGTTAEVPEVYRDASPISWVDSESAPMLLQHGGQDVRVSTDHLHQMAAALRAAGVEVATAEYPRFHHESIRNWRFTGGLSQAFLERHLAP